MSGLLVDRTFRAGRQHQAKCFAHFFRTGEPQRRRARAWTDLHGDVLGAERAEQV